MGGLRWANVWGGLGPRYPRGMPPELPEFLASPETLGAFVAAFEECTLPKGAWTHAAHVATGAVYVLRYRGEALGYLRTNISRFNESVGGVNGPDSGYHETLTRLWVLLIAAEVGGESEAHAAAYKAVAAFGHQNKLHAEYYSVDVVASREARAGWIAPDLDGPYPLAW